MRHARHGENNATPLIYRRVTRSSSHHCHLEKHLTARHHRVASPPNHQQSTDPFSYAHSGDWKLSGGGAPPAGGGRDPEGGKQPWASLRSVGVKFMNEVRGGK